MHAPEKKFFIILFGPTGVGKTDLSLELAKQLPVEIVNMDVGQLYTPLSIGTAKPDWRPDKTPHHLFDIIDVPRDYTVLEYREQALSTMEKIWHRNHIPILVGGSGFYLSSLFFPPTTGACKNHAEPSGHPTHYESLTPKDLWLELKRIDPERAAAIHPHDTYRINRALAIWQATGKKPSTYTSVYQPPASYFLIFLTRNRQELYARINERVESMLAQGWQQEVQRLLATPWESFLRTKGLIGYPELCDYVSGTQSSEKHAHVIQKIQQKTRAYAKRQETFWRMLEKKLRIAHATKELTEKKNAIRSHLITINLTEPASDQYISELLNRVVTSFYECAK